MKLEEIRKLKKKEIEELKERIKEANKLILTAQSFVQYYYEQVDDEEDHNLIHNWEATSEEWLGKISTI